MSRRIFVGSATDGASTPGSEPERYDGVVFEDITAPARARAEVALAERVGVATSDASHEGALVAGSSHRASNGAPGAGAVSLAAFKAGADELIGEFFEEQNFEEAQRALAALRAPAFGFELVRRLLSSAARREDRERELACRLVAYLSGEREHGLSMEAVGKGFERLFESVDDLEKDAPRARDVCGRFLARAVADEALPPAFVMDPYIAQLAGSIADDARALLEAEHGQDRLRKLFHVTSAFSTAELKAEVATIVAEFLVGGDADEAVKCVRELQVPFFGHEVVRRALAAALDRIRGDVDVAQVVAQTMRLFRALRDAGAVSSAQFAKGFARARGALSDTLLDSPRAELHLTAFEEACREARILEAPAA